MDFKYHSAELSTGRKYGFLDEHPADFGDKTLAILAIHGFPNTAQVWNSQIPVWTTAGYRVIAPDMLGYGETDKPAEISPYSQKSMIKDMVALLDHLQISQVVLVGHDWGAFFVYRFVGWHPERVTAVMTLSIPYIPPNPDQYIPSEVIATLIPDFGYQTYFASEESTSEIEANLETFFRLGFQKAPSTGYLINPILKIGEMRNKVIGHERLVPTPLAVSQEVFDYHLKLFGKHGMRGPLNWYRNGLQNHEDEESDNIPISLPETLPNLFIYGQLDYTTPRNFVVDMPKLVSDLKVIEIPGVSHWLTEEAGEEVNKHTLAFLQERVKIHESTL